MVIHAIASFLSGWAGRIRSLVTGNMDKSSLDVADTDSVPLEQLLGVYTSYSEQASRLEGYIWQTAALLGIGSSIGLVALASGFKNSTEYWGATIIAAIFAINASLVWWRFARRWWSIQHLKLEWMNEIEKRISTLLRLNGSLVPERDVEAMSQRRYLQQKGSWIERLKSINFDLPPEIQPIPSNRVKNYEYRGNQPASRILLFSNILLWLSFSVYVGSRVGTLPLTLAIFIALTFADLYIWRFH